MARTKARIHHDEVVRMIKAVQSCGLSVSSVSFDGEQLEVVVREPSKRPDFGPIREPTL
ncbi:hypothetical protein [uncultured Pelagibacterium sp.]|uniref:hypothetical protein n=1 Tax=uncultured Pelagibacterium sp. TaxID=1159875 RepID=UPI0030DDAAED|tara:strand:- start:352 stop:528 length:177 start_codon:yes stop_codon:yes gene_type:complete